MISHRQATRPSGFLLWSSVDKVMDGRLRVDHDDTILRERGGENVDERIRVRISGLPRVKLQEIAELQGEPVTWTAKRLLLQAIEAESYQIHAARGAAYYEPGQVKNRYGGRA